MKIDVGKIALVVVLIAGVQATTLYHRIELFARRRAAGWDACGDELLPE